MFVPRSLDILQSCLQEIIQKVVIINFSDMKEKYGWIDQKSESFSNDESWTVFIIIISYWIVTDFSLFNFFFNCYIKPNFPYKINKYSELKYLLKFIILIYLF